MPRGDPPMGLECLRTARGVLFDTNMLLLFIVGNASPELLPRCGRTKALEAEDFQLLVGPMAQVPETATLAFTPHVAAETWNLLENSVPSEPDLDRIAEFYASYVTSSKEGRPEARHLVRHSKFRRLGLTDTGVLRLARKKTVVVTADVDLTVALNEAKCPVLNFTHYQFSVA